VIFNEKVKKHIWCRLYYKTKKNRIWRWRWIEYRD